MGAERLLVQLYAGTPDEIEARKRFQYRNDAATSLLSVKMVILNTGTTGIYAVTTESQYRYDIERYIALGYQVERFFEAPTGAARKQLQRIK